MTDLATPITRTSIASQVEGRLTLTTGTPVTLSDVTGAGTVYFSPYLGDRISLLVGSRWVSRKFTEKNLTAQASLFRIMDVWGYDSAGTLALEQTAWDSGGQTTKSITGATNATPIVITSTSHGLSNGTYVGVASVGGNTAPNGKVWKVANQATNTFELEGSVGNGVYTSGGTAYVVPTARTTAIVLNGTNASGVYTKSGDATRRYLGSYMTFGTSGQTEDSSTKRLVFNYYNRRWRNMTKYVSSTHTYTTAAWRFWNADATARVEFLFAAQEDTCTFSIGGSLSAGAGYVSLGQNSISGLTPSMRNANASIVEVGQARVLDGILGFNYLQADEYGAASFSSDTVTVSGGILA